MGRDLTALREAAIRSVSGVIAPPTVGPPKVAEHPIRAGARFTGPAHCFSGHHMGVIVPFKRIKPHVSRPWPDARVQWHADAIDAFDAGRLSVGRLRALMKSDPAFARYATRRLGEKVGARLCGND